MIIDPLLAEAVAFVRTLDSTKNKAEQLEKLAPHLPIALLLEGLAIAVGFSSSADRGSVVEKLLLHLGTNASPEQYAQCLSLVQQLHFSKDQVKAIKVVLPSLPSGLLPTALEIATNIPDVSDRIFALLAISSYLSDDERNRLFSSILKQLSHLSYNDYEKEVIKSVLAVLPSELLPEATGALEDVLNTIDGFYWVDPYKPLIELVEAASHLPVSDREAMLNRSMESAKAIQNSSARARILAAIAAKLPRPTSEELILEVFDALDEAQDDSDFHIALWDLVKIVPSKYLPRVLHTARRISHDWTRNSVVLPVIDGCIPNATADVLDNLLEEIRTFPSSEGRARAYEEIIVRLPPEKGAAVFREALADIYRGANSKTLSKVGRTLSSSQRQDVLVVALDNALKEQNSVSREEMLCELVPDLPDFLFEKLINNLHRVPWDGYGFRYKEKGRLFVENCPDQLLGNLLAAWPVNEFGKSADAWRQRLENLSASERKDIFLVFLRSLASQPRNEVLEWVPFILELWSIKSNREATKQFLEAIHDMEKWFP